MDLQKCPVLRFSTSHLKSSMCHPAWLLPLVTSTFIPSSFGAPPDNTEEGTLWLKLGYAEETTSLKNDIHNIQKRQFNAGRFTGPTPEEYLRAYARLGDLERVKQYLAMPGVHVDSQDIR
ncbi:unnamed protein product, partial [Meganyctiphanes norvegica]